MKTIALNLIVGAGDGQVLKRCVEPIRNFFDGLVIGITTNDPDVLEVVENLSPSCMVNIPWSTEKHPLGHFGEARELVKQKTNADYIMWLDADDVLPIDEIERKLSEIKDCLEKNNIDFATMEYRLDYIGKDYGRILRRPRIFKNTDEIFWRYPVHEQLIFNSETNRQMRTAVLNNFWIEHKPTKNNDTSCLRNLHIIESIKGTDDYDWRMRYFHGLELLSFSKLYGVTDEAKKKANIQALELLADCVTEQEGTKEHNAHICISLAYEYLYGKQGHCIEIPKEFYNINKAETYIRLSLMLSSGFAEAYVILGDILSLKGNNEQAIELYKMALKQKIGMVELQLPIMYQEIPIRRLAITLENIDTELALWYAKRAIIFDEDYKTVYRRLLKKINKRVI